MQFLIALLFSRQLNRRSALTTSKDFLLTSSLILLTLVITGCAGGGGGGGSNLPIEENELAGSTWGGDTGLAVVDVTLSASQNTITLTTNAYPDFLLTQGTLQNNGPYVVLAQEQPAQTHSITFFSSDTDYVNTDPNSINVAQPPLFDLGYIGRPHPELADGQHWQSDTPPYEILSLDPISLEAWDVPAHEANQGYSGILRINVAALARNLDNDEFNGVKRHDDSSLLVLTDQYGGHTQPNGEYHLHDFLFSSADYKNKVIGYSYNDDGCGFAIMGLDTNIYKPIFEDNYLVGYDDSVEVKPAISGYKLADDPYAQRIQQDPVNGSKQDVPQSAAGLFHVDYVFSEEQPNDDSYLLDEFNMGFVDLNGKIVKAYVQTMNYPYLIHTPLSLGEGACKTAVEVQSGLSKQVLNHDNLPREYLIYIPEHDQYTSLSLVLNFHGSGMNAQGQMYLSDMRSLAEEENFILVYPQGTALSGGELHWNPLPQSVQGNKSDVDDLGFISSLIDELLEQYPQIEADQVYATGFSNGAGMTYGLASYLSEKLAAIAPVSGLMYNHMANNNDKENTAVIIFNGQLDTERPYQGLNGWMLSVEDSVEHWAEINKNSKKITEGITNNIIKTSFSENSSESAVESYKIQNGSHDWFDIEIDGKDLDQLIWDFFAVH